MLNPEGNHPEDETVVVSRAIAVQGREVNEFTLSLTALGLARRYNIRLSDSFVFEGFRTANAPSATVQRLLAPGRLTGVVKRSLCICRFHGTHSGDNRSYPNGFKISTGMVVSP